MVEAPPLSPCIGVCQIDAVSGLCLGCARSLDEIARWGAALPAQREAVLKDLPRRRALLGWPLTGPAQRGKP